MSRTFDLFKLHSPKIDNKPRKWINATGKCITDEVKRLIEDICQDTQLKIKDICKIVGKILDCHWMVIYNRFNGYKWVPLPVLITLLDTWKIFCNKKEVEYEIKGKYIQSKIEFLKTCGNTSKPVKAVKTISKNLCKIAGAHAADGTLYFNQTKNGSYYVIAITDEYKMAIRELALLINRVFGLKIKPRKRKYDNSWQIRFKNKVIGRYLNIFFEFPIGSKSHIVKEPLIIKSSSIRCRKGFLQGVMTFDGCVNKNNQIELYLRSKLLVKDIENILNIINLNARYSEIGGFFRLRTRIIKQRNLNEWKDIFFGNSEKRWKMINQTFSTCLHKNEPNRVEMVTYNL